MKILLTTQMDRILSKHDIDDEILLQYFSKTFLGSNKCIKLCHHVGYDIYKSYLSKTGRMLSLIQIQNVIIPIYFGDKHDPIAKNITKEIVMKHISQWYDKTLLCIEKEEYRFLSI